MKTCKRLLIVFAFVCIVVEAFAQQSPEPSKSVPINRAVSRENNTYQNSNQANKPIPCPSPVNTINCNCGQNPSSEEPTQPPKKPSQDPIIRYTFWLAVCAGLQTFILLGHGIVFSFALKHSSKTADATEETLRITQLPYIRVNDNKSIYSSTRSFGANTSVVVQIENIGKTAARNLKTAIKAGIKEEASCQKTPVDPIPTILHAGQIHNFCFNGFEPSDEIIKRFGEGKTRFSVWGDIKYQDVFKKAHCVIIDMFYISAEDRFGGQYYEKDQEE